MRKEIRKMINLKAVGEKDGYINNLKYHIPSDVIYHMGYIPYENLVENKILGICKEVFTEDEKTGEMLFSGYEDITFSSLEKVLLRRAGFPA